VKKRRRTEYRLPRAFISFATHSTPRNGVKIQNFHVIWWGRRFRIFDFDFDFDSDSDPDFDDCLDPVACGSLPDFRNAPKRCQTTSCPRFSRRGAGAARFRDVTTEERPWKIFGRRTK
jgi:hypothetical protein